MIICASFFLLFFFLILHAGIIPTCSIVVITTRFHPIVMERYIWHFDIK